MGSFLENTRTTQMFFLQVKFRLPLERKKDFYLAKLYLIDQKCQ